MAIPISHPFVASLYDSVVGVGDRLFLASLRDEVATDLSGSVLEIGSGTGSMLKPIERCRRSDVPLNYIGIEPDRSMRERSRDRLQSVDFPVETILARGEALPFPDDTFDTVLCSLVLCTVEDIERTLGEIARVLVPAGDLLVLEHVAAKGIEGAIQRTIGPAWSSMTGGCDPHRKTAELILATKQFHRVEAERRPVGIPPIRPFLIGRYRLS